MSLHRPRGPRNGQSRYDYALFDWPHYPIHDAITTSPKHLRGRKIQAQSADRHADVASAVAGETLTTRTGLRLAVRPVATDDEPLLKDLFDHLTPEDLRFRFLSGIEHVRHEQLSAMLSVDHLHAETFLAFDRESGRLVATAMLAADPELATVKSPSRCIRIIGVVE